MPMTLQQMIHAMRQIDPLSIVQDWHDPADPDSYLGVTGPFDPNQPFSDAAGFALCQLMRQLNRRTPFVWYTYLMFGEEGGYLGLEVRDRVTGKRVLPRKFFLVNKRPPTDEVGAMAQHRLRWSAERFMWRVAVALQQNGILANNLEAADRAAWEAARDDDEGLRLPDLVAKKEQQGGDEDA